MIGASRSEIIADMAGTQGASAAHLIQAFTGESRISPHRYLIGHRLDGARKLLIAVLSITQVAIDTGFYDQAHLMCTFGRFLQNTPGRCQHSAPHRTAHP